MDRVMAARAGAENAFCICFAAPIAPWLLLGMACALPPAIISFATIPKSGVSTSACKNQLDLREKTQNEKSMRAPRAPVFLAQHNERGVPR
jgi:hypothetical protein